MNAQGALDHLLPQGFHASILLPILVGILVLLVFTERLGWVYVGLVVPGYLAAVLALEPNGPTLGLTIVIEAIVTYGVVRFLSDILSRTGVWSPYFGRERFFLIVLVSVVVRQNSQIWLSPLIIEQINQWFGSDFIFEEGRFASVGTVLVPLIANMFWKIDVRRGLLQIGVPVAITYAIVRVVLLPYTNLDFEDELTLDAIALNFLNTPKVYVILLVGAILAARFNVLYGWDYNGIMVPSLLALSWVNPTAIAVTIVETLVLYGATKLIRSAPLVRMINFEGPRQIALVFTIDFFLKYAYAWCLSLYFPGIDKVTDFFGFGYIITSLLAVKMLQKGAVGRVLLPALHVSIVAFLAGNLVGWTLDQIKPKEPPAAAVATLYEAREQPTEILPRRVLGVAAVAAVRAKMRAPAGYRQGRPLRELERWAELWRHIDVWLARGAEADRRRVDERVAGFRPRAARSLAETSRVRPRHRGLTLALLPARFNGREAYGLYEREEDFNRQQGWDTAVLIPGAPGPVIEVPRPRTESPLAEVAAVLCLYSDCRAILFAGIDSADSGRTVGDALVHPRSTFLVAGRELRSSAIVQLRADPGLPVGAGRLSQQHKLPDQVNPRRLWPLDFSRLEPEWRKHPPSDAHKWSSRRDMVILRAHPQTWWQVLTRHAGHAESHPETSLAAWLAATFDGVTTVGAEQSLPSATEVGFLEHLLASRLLDSPAERAGWLDQLARLIDYRVVALPDCTGEFGCWVLAENAAVARVAARRASRSGPAWQPQPQPGEPQTPAGEHQAFVRRWGTLAVQARQLRSSTPVGELVRTARAGATTLWHGLALQPEQPAIAIEVPRPLLETGTWQLGLSLWQQSGGHVLLVGHDIPATHGVSHIDPTRVGNVRTPFQAMHLAIHDGFDGRAQPFIAQVRGFATWRETDEQLLVGLGFAVRDPARQSPLALRRLLDDGALLGWLRPRIRYVGGEPEHVFLRGKDNPQMALCQRLGRVDCALLWFSQPVRESYAEIDRARFERRLDQTGFFLTARDLLDVLLGDAVAPPAAPRVTRRRFDPRAAARPSPAAARGHFDRLLALAREYAVTEDMRTLLELRRESQRDPAIRVAIYWSSELSLAYLAVEVIHPEVVQRAAVLLADLARPCPGAADGDASTRAELASLIERRCQTIVVRQSTGEEAPGRAPPGRAPPDRGRAESRP